MKAAKERSEEYDDPARRDNPQGPNHGLGQSFEVPGKSVLAMVFGSTLLVKSARKAMVCSDVGTGFLQQLWEKSGGRLSLHGPVGQCCAYAQRL